MLCPVAIVFSIGRFFCLKKTVHWAPFRSMCLVLVSTLGLLLLLFQNYISLISKLACQKSFLCYSKKTVSCWDWGQWMTQREEANPASGCWRSPKSSLLSIVLKELSYVLEIEAQPWLENIDFDENLDSGTREASHESWAWKHRWRPNRNFNQIEKFRNYVLEKSNDNT